jgi:hypothetical protein
LEENTRGRIWTINTKGLIAFCGLDCSQCFGYTKTVSEAAKELRRVLRKELDSCALHPEFETCDKLKILEHFHKDEHLRNLRLIKKGPR